MRLGEALSPRLMLRGVVDTLVQPLHIGSCAMTALDCSEHQVYAWLSRGSWPGPLWELCLVAWQFESLPALLEGGEQSVGKKS